MSGSETLTVLAVDDEEAVLKLLEHQLMELRCAFIPTQSPAEAVHILQTREIAVLICDLRMPDIDGNAVMKTAREANPNIVSILLTATVDHEATIRAINEAGIWKFISKPWKRDELVSVVREGLARYSTLARQQEELTASPATSPRTPNAPRPGTRRGPAWSAARCRRRLCCPASAAAPLRAVAKVAEVPARAAWALYRR